MHAFLCPVPVSVEGGSFHLFLSPNSLLPVRIKPAQSQTTGETWPLQEFITFSSESPGWQVITPSLEPPANVALQLASHWSSEKETQDMGRATDVPRTFKPWRLAGKPDHASNKAK